MTFAVPLFLIAVLAAGIPVVLHLIHRQQAKNLPFPTLRFLKISAEKTRRRKRIHDLLLLLLRAAILLLLAIGLARPTITNLGSLWGGANTAVAIVLDNSASMGAIDGERSRFEIGAAAVEKILDELREGDQIAFLTTGGPDFPGLGKLDRTKEAVREILPQCQVGYERADLAAKVQRARDILDKATTPNKQIFVITDMQKASWEEGARGEGRGVRGEGREANEVDAGKDVKRQSGVKDRERDSDRIPLIFVDCSRKPKPNLSVRGVALSDTTPSAESIVAATAEFYNASTVPWPCVAELYLDGVRESSSPTLDIPPGERRKHVFPFACKTAGLHQGEIRLSTSDGLKYDDRRCFAVEADRAVPIAIVKNGRQEIPALDDSFYLERALSAGSQGDGPFRTTVLMADELATAPLGDYKAIFLVNLSAPNAEAADRLRNYLVGGGNLIWIAGDNVDCDAYNRMNELSGGNLLPAALVEVRSPQPRDDRDSWHVTMLDKQYPAFRLLIEPASLYESILVYKHIQLAVGQTSNLSKNQTDRQPSNSPNVEILAGLDDGEPLLVEKKSASGSVLLLGTSVHVSWTNLPLRPIFLPLVSRLLFELAGVESSHRSLLAGQPIELHFPNAKEPSSVEVVSPTGGTVRLKTSKAAGDIGQEFRFADTFEIGVYSLRVSEAAKTTTFAYAVNFDPRESEPAKIEHEDLEKRYVSTPMLFAGSPDELAATFKTLREGKSLWSVLLFAVLFVLVFETFLANRKP